MIDEDLNNLDELEDLDECLNFDNNKIIENLPQYTSQKLCEIIVCDRYLNFNPELALACMKELSSRRSSGDDFKFENYIDDNYNELPKIEISMPDIQSIFGKLLKIGG
jgi:hypothetical protein